MGIRAIVRMTIDAASFGSCRPDGPYSCAPESRVHVG